MTNLPRSDAFAAAFAGALTRSVQIFTYQRNIYHSFHMEHGQRGYLVQLVAEQKCLLSAHGALKIVDCDRSTTTSKANFQEDGFELVSPLWLRRLK